MQNLLSNGYQIFQGGPYIDLMSQLKGVGLVPTSVADIMRARLEAFNSPNSEQKETLLNNDFQTMSAVAYNDGRIKIVPVAQELKDISPNIKLIKGALPISHEEYRALEGKEIDTDFIKDPKLARDMGKEGVMNHPIWRTLVEDTSLLAEYTDLVIFAKSQEPYHNKGVMAISLDKYQGTPTMEIWGMMNLTAGSMVYGFGTLDSESRLIGIRPQGSARTLDDLVL